MDFKELFESEKRIIGLDIIRTYAILSVVLGHGNYLFPIEFRPYFAIPCFIDGVSIFFVLSGFLIGNIIIKNILTKGEFNFSTLYDFLFRRWMRTLPNYFLILLLLIIIDFKSWNYNFKFLLFLQNLTSSPPGFFGVSWSLSVEEWFYFLFPFSFFLFYKLFPASKEKLYLIILVLFLIFPLVLRWISINNGVSDFDSSIRKVVIYRLDSMMYGILGSYIFYKFNLVWRKYSKFYLLISLILLFPLLIYHVSGWFGMGILDGLSVLKRSIFIFNYESLCVLFLLPFLSNLHRFKVSFLNKIFAFLSKISYSMYLVHGSLVLWLITPKIHSYLETTKLNFLQISIINNLIYIGLTLFFSLILYLCFEKPLLNWRDKKHLLNN